MKTVKDHPLGRVMRELLPIVGTAEFADELDLAVYYLTALSVMNDVDLDHVLALVQAERPKYEAGVEALRTRAEREQS